RCAPITITDLGDHDGAIWLITIAEIRTRAGLLRRRDLPQLRGHRRRGGGSRPRARLGDRPDARRAAGGRDRARGADPARLLPVRPEPVAERGLPDQRGRVAGRAYSGIEDQEAPGSRMATQRVNMAVRSSG